MELKSTIKMNIITLKFFSCDTKKSIILVVSDR
jgi:hypothetical protein